MGKCNETDFGAFCLHLSFSGPMTKVLTPEISGSELTAALSKPKFDCGTSLIIKSFINLYYTKIL